MKERALITILCQYALIYLGILTYKYINFYRIEDAFLQQQLKRFIIYWEAFGVGGEIICIHKIEVMKMWSNDFKMRLVMQAVAKRITRFHRLMHYDMILTSKTMMMAISDMFYVLWSMLHRELKYIFLWSES